MLPLSPINEHAVACFDAKRIGLAWFLVVDGGFGGGRKSRGGVGGLDEGVGECL